MKSLLLGQELEGARQVAVKDYELVVSTALLLDHASCLHTLARPRPGAEMQAYALTLTSPPNSTVARLLAQIDALHGVSHKVLSLGVLLVVETEESWEHGPSDLLRVPQGNYEENISSLILNVNLKRLGCDTRAASVLDFDPPSDNLKARFMSLYLLNPVDIDFLTAVQSIIALIKSCLEICGLLPLAYEAHASSGLLDNAVIDASIRFASIFQGQDGVSRTSSDGQVGSQDPPVLFLSMFNLLERTRRRLVRKGYKLRFLCDVSGFQKTLKHYQRTHSLPVTLDLHIETYRHLASKDSLIQSRGNHHFDPIGALKTTFSDLTGIQGSSEELEAQEPNAVLSHYFHIQQHRAYLESQAQAKSRQVKKRERRGSIARIATRLNPTGIFSGNQGGSSSNMGSTSNLGSTELVFSPEAATEEAVEIEFPKASGSDVDDDPPATILFPVTIPASDALDDAAPRTEACPSVVWDTEASGERLSRGSTPLYAPSPRTRLSAGVSARVARLLHAVKCLPRPEDGEAGVDEAINRLRVCKRQTAAALDALERRVEEIEREIDVRGDGESRDDVERTAYHVEMLESRIAEAGHGVAAVIARFDAIRDAVQEIR